ncbi:hypothetical protein J2Z60_002170 [Lactobacillus colini]|uniref:Uncharacterized protein n=1 Tax=Lactobacillus colini TaxID=1819254 RepID=A0ABS4MHZ2_9LACO|nr:hypothetical protein [Lactobacillus colini]MBP2058969.1 hypothetical protein [Lactobacillus colini]
MGGRGANFRVSIKGHRYGTEFRSVFKYKNIKFVKNNGLDYRKGKKNKAIPATLPLETQTEGRVYISVDNQNELKSIAFYKNKKKYKQIDIDHKHKIKGKYIQPHTHLRYYNAENGTKKLTRKERKMIAEVIKVWKNVNK